MVFCILFFSEAHLVSEQPRLLLCCFDVIPAPTGLSRRVTEYLKGLSDRFQVVVLSIKTPDHSHIERYHGARLLRVPVGSGDLQSRIQSFDRAVRRQLESEEYVIAHFFDPFGGYALADSRAQYGFRLVYDAQTFPSQELRYTHPSIETDRRFLSKIRRQELFCLMNSDAVICGAEVTRSYVLKLGAPPAALHVFHAPVDLAPYTRDAMGTPDGSPMKLLHLGSQIGYQGLPTLLKAMQLALRQVDLRLLVVGPTHPEWQTPLEELVSELKLAGKVEFQPPVVHDNLCKVIATADVGVAALDASDRNLQQGGPIAKLGEYLAAGRPVIATDLPISRELLPEGARVLFPAGDFKALGELLVQLATNPAQRVALGEAARAGAARFDASAVRGQLHDLYGALSTRGKVSPTEAQGEVTQLRKAGSDTSKIALARSLAAEANRTASETVDEEPPVVVGQSIEHSERAEEAARSAVTDPLPRSNEAPVVMGMPLPASRDEQTPIRPGPDSTAEPTPITSARRLRVSSKTGKAVSAPPQPTATIPIVPSEDQKTGPIELPPRLKRTSEGKGIRSPALPPPSASPPVRRSSSRPKAKASSLPSLRTPLRPMRRLRGRRSRLRLRRRRRRDRPP